MQFASAPYVGPDRARSTHNYHPRVEGDAVKVADAAALIASARRPILYTGGGVINDDPAASRALREFAAHRAPITSTLMGLGAYAADDPQWLGMVGMHGAYEANNAMHDCDVMVAIGARFDDRVTGRLNAFSPGSKRIHIDIDPSSIGKVVRTDIGIVGDAGHVLGQLIAAWKRQKLSANTAALKAGWAQIDRWRARRGFDARR